MYKKLVIFVLLVYGTFYSEAQPLLPRPTPQQTSWHNMEYYWFAHFGPNTFTGKEWGHGDEKEEVFNPVQLDCTQWARLAKASGAKGIIITAKHHDGFCLWPSKYSTHTVRESKWKNGKGDVLKELSDACRAFGLKFGVYISPWDRNHPKYGSDEYNGVFINMMKELFSNYGPIWELWWDGANGEGPNGKKQVYDWHRFETFVRKVSPRTIIFSDIGPDCRWVGNESGIAGLTNWNNLDTAGFSRGAGAPLTDTLNQGNVNGRLWIPAECDVSIRPGWFYHAEEDNKVKTPEELFKLYLKSVGRGANLLLNVPPNDKGLIAREDSTALIGFKKLRDVFTKQVAAKYFADRANHYSLTWKVPKTINTVLLKENILNGQKIQSFVVQVRNGNKIVKEVEGTTIGRKRILTFPNCNANSITVLIHTAKSPASLLEISVYKIEESLLKE